MNISKVVNETEKNVDEVIVVDDHSTDNTGQLAKSIGAKVIRSEGTGYINAIKTGFREAQGDIVVTVDGDGEHDPEEISLLLAPLLNGEVDLVLGKRKKIPRVSERIISFLAKLKTGVTDSGTGFRAMKRELALKLELTGTCICGISVLKAYDLGAEITEIPITINRIGKKRKIAWAHILQIFYVIKYLIRGLRTIEQLYEF